MARTPDFDGIKRGALVTFKSALVKGTDEDKLVALSANGTVALCTEDQNFIGIVRIIDDSDKAASVQIDGFVADYPYDTDHAPTVTDGQGWQALTCGSAATKVKAATEGVTIPLRRVVEVDTSAHTITFQL
jgi:hypothetical protein